MLNKKKFALFCIDKLVNDSYNGYYLYLTIEDLFKLYKEFYCEQPESEEQIISLANYIYQTKEFNFERMILIREYGEDEGTVYEDNGETPDGCSEEYIYLPKQNTTTTKKNILSQKEIENIICSG